MQVRLGALERGGRGELGWGREHHAKARAVALGAVALEMRVVPPQDALAHRQAEPGAVLALGAEEGLEDASLQLWAHARPIVLDHDRGRALLLAGANADAAAIADRIEGVRY